MHVYFESHRPEGDQLRERAIRRANSAARVLTAISRVKVQLSDAEDYSGGLANKRCRVEFTMGDTGAVVATARTTDWRSALDWAFVRAARALPGLLRRNRKRLRPASLAPG